MRVRTGGRKCLNRCSDRDRGFVFGLLIIGCASKGCRGAHTRFRSGIEKRTSKMGHRNGPLYRAWVLYHPLGEARIY